MIFALVASALVTKLPTGLSLTMYENVKFCLTLRSDEMNPPRFDYCDVFQHVFFEVALTQTPLWRHLGHPSEGVSQVTLQQRVPASP